MRINILSGPSFFSVCLLSFLFLHNSQFKKMDHSLNEDIVSIVADEKISFKTF